MSTAGGAPDPLWAVPDDVLDDGTKLTVMRLWSWADFDDQHACRPCKVWAKEREGMTYTEMLHAQLAEERGCSVRKIRRHLGKARALGLVVTHGKAARLFPTVDGRDLTADGPGDRKGADRKGAEPDRERSEPDRKGADGDHKRSLQLNPPNPPAPTDHEVEARDPHDPAPTPPPVDPWPARVREASEDQRKRETHEAIQAQQLDLEARRTETRARMEAQQAAEFAATDETSAQLEAIRAVSPEWGRCLMWPKWESSAIAATIELNLDAAAVTWLLEHHDSTGRELTEAGTLREAETAGRPTRRELWSRWSTHRAWVQEALLERERATRPAQPDWRTRPRLGGQKAWDEL